MFDIGFSELLLVMVIGLVVLGPERLPVAVKTVAGWIRALRTLASSVQNELTQELKIQELQNSLKKVEQAGLQNLTPELKASMDELREAANAFKRPIESSTDAIKATETANSAASLTSVPSDVTSSSEAEAKPVVALEPMVEKESEVVVSQPHPLVNASSDLSVKASASHQSRGDH